ncbi:hypothetical protein [Streptomyces sp. NPDC003036]|uniref:hypothetical protein n=1 Tax=Streptomyces sp. NPDC003036 TaxID=3154442 RepID=UPI0033B55ECD
MSETRAISAAVRMLEAIRQLTPLTREGVAALFAAQGWDGSGASWDKDGTGGWVHPYNGGVRVEFTLWMREPDEDTGYFDDVEAAYAAGERALAAFLPRLESSALARHLRPAGSTEEDADEFVAHKRWSLGGRTLVAGVVQEDTDLPVRVVLALE